MASLRCSNPASQNSAPVYALLGAGLNVSQINLRPGSPFAPVFFLPNRKQHAVPVPPETLRRAGLIGLGGGEWIIPSPEKNLLHQIGHRTELVRGHNYLNRNARLFPFFVTPDTR